MKTIRMFIKNIGIGTFLAISLNLSGQKMTTAFQEVRETPEGKGFVYVYSEKKKQGFSCRINKNHSPVKSALNSGVSYDYENQ